CPAGAWRFLEREDVFNVSITRARDEVIVFHSFDREGLPAGSLAGAWLASLEMKHRPSATHELCQWIREVARALEGRGLRSETGLSVGGVPLDLLVRGDRGARLALDLVGQRGRAGDSVPLRDRLLLER